jgi:hypothetical protein
MQRAFWGLLTAAALLACPAARADVFQLADGGELRGELLNPDEVPRRTYAIRTVEGAEITLERAQVAKVVRETEAQIEYERIRATYADTVEAQWALAEWCLAHKLAECRRTHLERVIALDPEHLPARRALGYSQVDGRWVTQEQIMTERGYLRYKGKWVLPQEIELMEARRKVELAEKEWFQKLKRWRAWLDDDKKSAEAQENLAAIDDPFAYKALKSGLEDEENDAVRILYIQALGRIATPATLEHLVAVTLDDKVEEVRLTALDQLAAHKHPDLTALFVKKLKDKDNVKVNRAAQALARMEDPSAIGPLIDALITRHKFKVTYGSPGGVGAGFDRKSGGGGISAGSSTRIVTEQLQNEMVRDALIQLTEVNFQYDVKTWKAWHAAQKRDATLNGRRD